MGLGIVLTLAISGCAANVEAGAPGTTAGSSSTTTPAKCDFEVGPAVVNGDVSQSSGGIGGWVWHDIRPNGCNDLYPVLNLDPNRVLVRNEPCGTDCVADGIYRSTDTYKMELSGRFVERSEVQGELINGTDSLVFIVK